MLTSTPMILFFVGFVEMIIVTAQTKSVADSKIIMSGAVTLIHTLIWYYVLSKIVENISNWNLAILYGVGCTLGTIACTAYYQTMEKRKRRRVKKASALSEVVLNTKPID